MTRAQRDGEKQTTTKDMSWLRRYRFWFLGVFSLLVVEVIVQLLYPADRSVPFATLNGEAYGYRTSDEVGTRTRQAFNDAMSVVTVKGDKRQTRTPLSKLGFELNEAQVAATLLLYTIPERLIPFSLLFKQPALDTLPVRYNADKLERYAREVANTYTYAPQNARIAIKDGAVQAIPSVDGRTVQWRDVLDALQRDNYNFSETKVDVKGATKAADKTVDDFAAVKEKAERAINKTITISLPNAATLRAPSAQEIAKWLQLSEASDGTTDVRVDTQKVQQYIANLNRTVRKPAGKTIVHIVDGKEKSREKGEPGQEVDSKHIEQIISSDLFLNQTYLYVAGTYKTVQPTVIYKQSFTSSQAGLQAKIDQLGKTYNVRISLNRLDAGAKWHASTRGSESTPSASTYKLYIALKLFDEIDKGKISWNDRWLDTNVAGCFERMIVVSTNQCAEEFMRVFGRQNINNYIYSKGISHATTFLNPEATHTSADDLLKVVTGIHQGTLVKGANRERLLDAMSRQIWRKGVPTGTKGWAQDKVGFLWDYVHDTAIVHHPRGTYTVAIMTKGASYDTIAQITREIEALMYP